MTTQSPGTADSSADPAPSALLESEPATRPSLQQLFRTAEKFCFSWPVHTFTPRGTRPPADS